MATKLVLQFDTAAGTKKFSYNYIAPSAATQSRVVELMNTMIANGEIFKYPPLSKVSASLETTTVTDIAVN